MLEVAKPRAAIFRGHCHTEESILAKQLPKLTKPVPAIFLVNFVCEWGQLLLGKAKDGVAKLKRIKILIYYLLGAALR